MPPPLRCFNGKGTENKTRLRLGRVIFCTGLLVLGGINSYTARNKRMEKAVFPGTDNQILAVANLQIIDPASPWRQSWWVVFDW